ncbi:ATP-dependent RNA helicase [Pseudoloma neurophilia]|uniref:RNA helicase n=1 Tax=Pseudoloma neurophilia TaxID=146866 RepID=A0A0R0LW35_9MICR|nr:ATP-dependent RNA helicase [Pseudoloma neurophilia]
MSYGNNHWRNIKTDTDKNDDKKEFGWSLRKDRSSSDKSDRNESYGGSSGGYGNNKNNRSGWNNNRDNYRGNDSNRSSWRDDSRGSGWSNNWQTRVVDKPAASNNPPVEFEKNFYEEKVLNKRLVSQNELRDFRSQNQMKIIGSDVPPPLSDFSDLDLPKSVFDQFKNKGFKKPMAIQAQGWPMALAGRDMVGIAETGSGKTLSFALPALIHAAAQQPLRSGDGPIVLVLAPTRELCVQIQEVISEFERCFKLRSHAVYGGASAFPQKTALRRGIEVLVATPGRLIDLMDQGCCDLSRVSFLVLDEADRMLDMGFEPQLRQIIPKTNSNRQTLMWSATWPRAVRDLASSFMNDFIQVTIGEDELTSNKKIQQVVKVIEEREKVDHLLNILEGNKKKLIIFCNKKRTCDYLQTELERNRFDASAIHGDKTQNIRDRVISDFKTGRKNILIATDVAARGLDVKDVEAVINFDFPPTCDSYVHRIGRTARGNQKEGLAIAFFTREDQGNAKELCNILKSSNQSIPDELQSFSRSSLSSRSTGSYRFNRSRNNSSFRRNG